MNVIVIILSREPDLEGWAAMFGRLGTVSIHRGEEGVIVGVDAEDGCYCLLSTYPAHFREITEDDAASCEREMERSLDQMFAVLVRFRGLALCKSLVDALAGNISGRIMIDNDYDDELMSPESFADWMHP